MVRGSQLVAIIFTSWFSRVFIHPLHSTCARLFGQLVLVEDFARRMIDSVALRYENV